MLAVMPARAVRFVALGDSYTIGTSVAEAERWPNQLVARLDVELVAASPRALGLELVANLAVNGYTSGDVIGAELPQLAALRPEFTTLLVGVNDVVRGVPAAIYRANVGAIFRDLVARVGPDRVLGLTTPDYTVTPVGTDFGDPTAQAAGIRETNRVFMEVAVAHGVTVVDIHDISLRAATDRGLVAWDGLHPSGAQYRLWVERIAPVVERLLT